MSGLLCGLFSGWWKECWTWNFYKILEVTCVVKTCNFLHFNNIPFDTLQQDSVHLPFSADYFEAFRNIQNNSFFISKHIISMEIKMTLRVISQCLILTSISSSAHGRFLYMARSWNQLFDFFFFFSMYWGLVTIAGL